MEIDFNPSLFPVGKTPSAKPAPKAAEAQSDASFPAATALEQALRALPGQRAAEIDRAQPLVRDTAYPPQETVQKIAALLAPYLASPDQETP